jgi:hypothetical protein
VSAQGGEEAYECVNNIHRNIWRAFDFGRCQRWLPIVAPPGFSNGGSGNDNIANQDQLGASGTGKNSRGFM